MMPEPPEVRWCVHFETASGQSNWVDQLAKHPAAAKCATVDELDRMGYEVKTFHSVTRTDAKKSRAALRIQWADSDGLAGRLVEGTIGALFDQERRTEP